MFQAIAKSKCEAAGELLNSLSSEVGFAEHYAARVFRCETLRAGVASLLHSSKWKDISSWARCPPVLRLCEKLPAISGLYAACWRHNEPNARWRETFFMVRLRCLLHHLLPF